MQDTFKLIRGEHGVDLLKLGIVIQVSGEAFTTVIPFSQCFLLLLIIYNIFIISVLENYHTLILTMGTFRNLESWDQFLKQLTKVH